MLLLFLFTWLCFAAPASVGGVTLTSLEAAQDVEDPRRLMVAADHWRDRGKTDLAKGLYGLALDREEWFAEDYIHVRDGLRQALILEHLGNHEASAALYRQGFAEDILTTMLVLRIRSMHPQRDALFDEAVKDVKDRVARAKNGEQVPIYITKKGAPRFLNVMSSGEVLDQLRQDNGKFRYCYIDDLVITPDDLEALPERVLFNRCVIGRLRIVDHDVDTFDIRAIVLDELSLGKTWKDDKVNTQAFMPSRLKNAKVVQSVVLGRSNFQGVEITGRNALFVMTVFEGPADFRDTLFDGTADFRYSVFGADANYKRMRLTDAAFFGNTRYTQSVNFREMFSEQDLYFNSADFEGPASFDKCEWARGATFENSSFEGPVSFNKSKMGGRLNMSRSVIAHSLNMREMQLYGMDFIGADIEGDAAFVDVHFGGKVRFSLDDVTRAQHMTDPTPLLPLYRDYQGDKDREEPLTTQNAYGVTVVDDLTARVQGNISFNNSVFEGFCIFEHVAFGRPGRPTTASFYNTQFLGETHFERTEWFGPADFTTIFANELAMNEAHFHHTLNLDDANIRGRATMTDATFENDATFSMYGAEIGHFEIARDHVENEEGEHRMFYEQCALGELEDPQNETRIRRIVRDGPYDEDAVRVACYDRIIDEYIDLKDSFGERAMIQDEDWAYWWMRHHEIGMQRAHGGWTGWLTWAYSLPLFEMAFGWGVRLENLAVTSFVVCLFFAFLYRWFCPDTLCTYNGDDVAIRDIPWHGLFYISLQSFGAFNTGWDFGADDARFQYLNTVQTYVGIIVLTFFVGAYTRMILA